MTSFLFLRHFSGSGRGWTPRPLPPAVRFLAAPPFGANPEAPAPDADSPTAASTLKVHGGLVGKINPLTLQIGFGVLLCPIEGIGVVLELLKCTTKLGVAHKVRGGSLGTREVPSFLVIPWHGSRPPSSTDCFV